MLIPIICLVLSAICFVLLFLVPRGSARRRFAPWARLAFTVASVIGFVWAIINTLLVWRPVLFTRHTRLILQDSMFVLSGAVVGILILFLIGEARNITRTTSHEV